VRPAATERGAVAERQLLGVSGLLRLLLFTAGLFGVSNFLDDFAFFRVAQYQLVRQDIPDPLFNSSVYVGTYLLSFAGLVVLYLHASRWIRWPAYTATAITATIHLGFRQFNGYGFTYHEASLIWAEIAFIDEALLFGFGSYAFPLLASVAVVLSFERWIRPALPTIRSWTLVVVPIAAVFVCQELLERTYTKVYQTPIPYRVAMLTDYTYRHRLLFYGRREEPYFHPIREPVARHLLLVVDESVTGDMLGVNSAFEDTTPFLESIPDRIINYGVVSSPSNLSSTSHIILQSGLREDQIPDRDLRALKNPNLFSYMQRAGYQSFLIDAQIYSSKPTNLMTGFDLEKLDGHFFVRVANVGAPEYEMDLRALDRIEKIISEEERSFIYLLKSGAHFPYDAKYPPDRAFFRPTLSSGGDGGNLGKTLNSYRNALRWTVDDFIRTLFERFESRRTDLLVIYTSDHGQSLADAVEDSGTPRIGRPTRWPHAVPVDPPAQQASVPLILFAFAPDARRALTELYQPSLMNRVNGFEIFPSLLQLAGYDYVEIRERYAPSVFDGDAPRGQRRFVSGNLFGIGGGFYQNKLIRDATYLNAFDPD
jgi:lipid A ethanolaminephosphotransferase